MIPRAHLTEWSREVPWPEINQVDRDLAPLIAAWAPRYDARQALARVRRDVLDVLDA